MLFESIYLLFLSYSASFSTFLLYGHTLAHFFLKLSAGIKFYSGFSMVKLLKSV